MIQPTAFLFCVICALLVLESSSSLFHTEAKAKTSAPVIRPKTTQPTKPPKSTKGGLGKGTTIPPVATIPPVTIPPVTIPPVTIMPLAVTATAAVSIGPTGPRGPSGPTGLTGDTGAVLPDYTFQVIT